MQQKQFWGSDCQRYKSSWEITEEYSHRDLKPMAFLVSYTKNTFSKTWLNLLYDKIKFIYLKEVINVLTKTILGSDCQRYKSSWANLESHFFAILRP